MQTTLQTLTKKYSLLASLMLLTGVLTGCAAPGAGVGAASALGASVKSEDAVRVRAQQRWDWLIAGKYADVYSYTTPAYRGLHTAQDYRNRFGTGASWVGARVQSVECAAPERCTAQVAVDTRVVARGFKEPITTSMSETWLYEEGQWWYHQVP